MESVSFKIFRTIRVFKDFLSYILGGGQEKVVEFVQKCFNIRVFKDFLSYILGGGPKEGGGVCSKVFQA